MPILHGNFCWEGGERKSAKKLPVTQGQKKKQARKTGKHSPKSLTEKGEQNGGNRNYKPVPGM